MVPDEIFANARLAQIYDHLEADRRDLDAYMAMVREFGARSVLDVGCGTGTFACLLAAAGVDVVGVDPAAASLDVARCKPGADQVRWLLGDATMLSSIAVDLAAMTGNIAQVFVDDEEWLAALASIRGALRPSGRLVFEVRDPARRGWENWNRAMSFARTEIPDVGTVEPWVELTDVSPPLISFRLTYHLEKGEIEASLAQTGFEVRDVRAGPSGSGTRLRGLAGCRSGRRHLAVRT